MCVDSSYWSCSLIKCLSLQHHYLPLIKLWFLLLTIMAVNCVQTPEIHLLLALWLLAYLGLKSLLPRTFNPSCKPRISLLGRLQLILLQFQLISSNLFFQFHKLFIYHWCQGKQLVNMEILDIRKWLMHIFNTFHNFLWFSNAFEMSNYFFFFVIRNCYQLWKPLLLRLE